MLPPSDACALLSNKLAQYKALPYASVERMLWVLVAAELMITAFSIVALVPEYSGGGKKADVTIGCKLHRTLRRTPMIVGLLLAHIELLNAFFTLEKRRASMNVRPEELRLCSHVLQNVDNYKLHVSRTNTPGPSMIIMFVSACIAGVLLLRFVVSTFDEKQVYDDIAAECHASYDFIVPDKVAYPEKVHRATNTKYPPPSTLPPPLPSGIV